MSGYFRHTFCLRLTFVDTDVFSDHASMLAYFALSSINSRRGATCSPIRIEKVLSASAASTMVTCLSRRCSGSMVVSQSCVGIISPRPLYRCRFSRLCSPPQWRSTNCCTCRSFQAYSSILLRPFVEHL